MIDKNRAVFVDRDGVVNALVYNGSTGDYESPHTPNDFHVIPGALQGLLLLQKTGFLLFLVSNQPSYAKGKTSLASLHAVHEALVKKLTRAGVKFTEYYYC